jgi:hypothetical protein
MVPFPQGASMAIDPEGIVDTLRELARLDPVELGLQGVLDQTVQAATTCCGITGGVGLLLLGPDDQLHYIAVAAPRRRLLGVLSSRTTKAHPLRRSSRTSRCPAQIFAPSDAGRRSGSW